MNWLRGKADVEGGKSVDARRLNRILRDKNTLDYSGINFGELDDGTYKFDFSPRRCVGCRETKPVAMWGDGGPLCSECIPVFFFF